MRHFILAIASLCCLAVATATVADIVLTTTSQQRIWIADGVTEHRMDVRMDSTQHPTDEIVSAEWDVNNASPTFSCTRAELPDNINNPSQNPEDFFSGWAMDSGPGGSFNLVDADFTGGESTANGRLTQNGATGPSNREGLLGHYWFTVPPGTTSGQYSFNTNAGFIFDATLTLIWQHNAGIVAINDPIHVVQSYQEAYASCMSGPGNAYPGGLQCETLDVDNDGDLDLQDWSAYQQSHPAVPTP